MSQTIKFNLPKVHLKIKTAAIDTIESEVHIVPQKEYGPSILQERVKMKKEIQESYIRFRRHKKNNYIKQYSSSKRSHSDRKVNTIDLSKKIKNHYEKIDLCLETEQNEKIQVLHKHSKQESHPLLMMKPKQNQITPRRELLSGSFRSPQMKNSLLARHYSLYDTQIARDVKQHFELKGKQWNCNNQNESKKIRNHIMKINQQHLKHKKVSGKSSAFRIQAWKPDRLSQSRAYFECQQLQIDY